MHCACNPRINGIWVVSYMRDNFNPIAIQITNMANLKFFWIIKTIRTPTRERAVLVEIAELGVEKISWEESSNWGWEKGSTHRNKSPIAKNKRERERERERAAAPPPPPPMEITGLWEGRKKFIIRESSNWGWEKGNTDINSSPVVGD